MTKTSTVVDKIKELGLSPGDTIKFRENFVNGPWVEYRLQLLWHGEQVAVWLSSTRLGNKPNSWSTPRETARPTLAYGNWIKQKIK